MARRYRETDSAMVREELARYRNMQPCPDCGGTRLRREARNVFLVDEARPRAAAHGDLRDQPRHAAREPRVLPARCKLRGAKAEIADKVVREIGLRLKFLNDVGLNYLSLDRSAETLSGGEAQRIRLASQIGSGLTGVMYVLDEPSIGLHQRDNDRLIGTLQASARHRQQRDRGRARRGHDPRRRPRDRHGPGRRRARRPRDGAGHLRAGGGHARVADRPVPVGHEARSRCPSAARPGCRWSPSRPSTRARRPSRFPPSPAAERRAAREAQHLATQGDLQEIRVVGATGNNLKNVSVAFPVGLLTCVTGVSGSGKSTLVNDTLYTAVARTLYRAHEEPAAHEAVEGIEYFDKVINVDQSPIGRTPRSNPATYTGLFTPIRELMAETNTARERGYGPGASASTWPAAAARPARATAWSRSRCTSCPTCTCPATSATASATTARRWRCSTRASNIAQILDMTVEAAHEFLKAVPTIERKLHTLLDVGLSLHQAGPGGDHAVGRRGAAREAGAGTVASATPAARSTSWTSRPPACTSPTSSCCSRCCTSCATRATPSS